MKPLSSIYILLSFAPLMCVALSLGFIVDKIFEKPWPYLAILSLGSRKGNLFQFWCSPGLLSRLTMFLSQLAQLFWPRSFLENMPVSSSGSLSLSSTAIAVVERIYFSRAFIRFLIASLSGTCSLICANIIYTCSMIAASSFLLSSLVILLNRSFFRMTFSLAYFFFKSSRSPCNFWMLSSIS